MPPPAVGTGGTVLHDAEPHGLRWNRIGFEPMAIVRDSTDEWIGQVLQGASDVGGAGVLGNVS